MDQSKARDKIQQFVEKFQREQAAGVIGQYNESETKTGFIEPLLQALGCSTINLNNPEEMKINNYLVKLVDVMPVLGNREEKATGHELKNC